jgi:hypothetical protein
MGGVVAASPQLATSHRISSSFLPATKLFWERHNLPAEFASGDTGRSMVCALHSVRSAKDARHELQQLQDDLHQQYIRTKSDVAA